METTPPRKPKGIRFKPKGLKKYWPDCSLEQAELERAKLAKKQDSKCAICKKPESNFRYRLHVDHNHKTGQVRGLLCFYCNKFVVGRHDYESAKKLLEYLKIEVQKDN